MASEVEQQKAISKMHKTWMIDLLKSKGDKCCTYEEIVQAGEEKHCDTVGAMLKLLKKDKAIDFKQMFLMYPMHKDEIVTLINPDFVP